MTDQLTTYVPTPDRIFQIGFGFWASRALLSAVELGVFTELARAPATLDTLASKLGIHERGARDFLDALVALELIERNGSTYANTPESFIFLDRSKNSYVGGVLEMAAERLWPSWGRLTQGLKTGQPQNVEADQGTDLFGTLYQDSDRLRNFLSGMTGSSAPAAFAIAKLLPWKDIDSFADIGCAEGGFTCLLATSHPHLQGIGFDLPQVEPIFGDFVRANGLDGRVEFHSGDFFKDPLPTADVLVMGHILHDWDMETKRMLLAKAHAALPKGGRLVVYEMLIDDERRTAVMGLLMSLNMLVETRGGFDYTGADCSRWMREAGFRKTEVHHLAGPYSAIIATK